MGCPRWDSCQSLLFYTGTFPDLMPAILGISEARPL